MDKEPGQRTREAFEACFVGYAKMIMQPGAWDRVSSQQKAAWVQMEAAIEAPHLAEVERLKARVAELEASRDVIAAKLGEAIELAGDMMPYVDEYFKKKWGFWDAFGALCTYHGSLAQEPPPDLPALGRDRPMPRTPTVDRMDAAPARDEHLDRPEDRPGHVCEVGGCPECDKAARERDEHGVLLPPRSPPKRHR